MPDSVTNSRTSAATFYVNEDGTATSDATAQQKEEPKAAHSESAVPLKKLGDQSNTQSDTPPEDLKAKREQLQAEYDKFLEDAKKDPLKSKLLRILTGAAVGGVAGAVVGGPAGAVAGIAVGALAGYLVKPILNLNTAASFEKKLANLDQTTPHAGAKLATRLGNMLKPAKEKLSAAINWANNKLGVSTKVEKLSNMLKESATGRAFTRLNKPSDSNTAEIGNEVQKAPASRTVLGT